MPAHSTESNEQSVPPNRKLIRLEEPCTRIPTRKRTHDHHQGAPTSTPKRHAKPTWTERATPFKHPSSPPPHSPASNSHFPHCRASSSRTHHHHSLAHSSSSFPSPSWRPLSSDSPDPSSPSSSTYSTLACRQTHRRLLASRCGCGCESVVFAGGRRRAQYC